LDDIPMRERSCPPALAPLDSLRPHLRPCQPHRIGDAMSHTFDIRIGSTVSFDGSLCTVIEIACDAVVLVDGAKRPDACDSSSFCATPRMRSGFRPRRLHSHRSPDLGGRDGRSTRRGATKAAHVREMRTGFASGMPTLLNRTSRDRSTTRSSPPSTSAVAPRPQSLASARRRLKRWGDRFDEGEDLALLDFRKTSWTPALSGLDPRWVDMCRRVVEENVRGARAASRPRSRSCWRGSSASTRIPMCGSPPSPQLVRRSPSSPVGRDVRREHARPAIHRHTAARTIRTVGRDKTR
jgi:hypothetical protein